MVEMRNSGKPIWKCPEADGPSGYPGLVLSPLREWLWARASEVSVIGGRGGEREYQRTLVSTSG